MNHKVTKDWNPEYVINNYTFTSKIDVNQETITEEKIILFLKEIGEEHNLKKYYYSDSKTLKIFLKGGYIVYSLNSNEGEIETSRKRPIFFHVDWLHYNPNLWWTYFSDIYAVSLIILAVTGLFVRRGKKGIKWRGTIVASLGLIIPIIILIIFG